MTAPEGARLLDRIALLDDLDRPCLIDSPLELGHALAIPGRAMEPLRVIFSAFLRFGMRSM